MRSQFYIMKKIILKIWGNYKLSIILFLLFLITWLFQFLFEIQELKVETLHSGRSFDWEELWIKFWSSTFQNWQSEFLQLLTFVVLTALFVDKGTQENRSSEERLEKKLDLVITLLSNKQEDPSNIEQEDHPPI